MVEASLGIDHVAHALFQRLDDADCSVETVVFIHPVDHPVHEGAEEVPLSELQYFYGTVQRLFTVQFFHSKLLNL